MRDFIYGKSDVLVALLIIAIAGTVIFTRVNAIMEYPARVAAEAEEQAAEDENAAGVEGLVDLDEQAGAGGDGASGEAQGDSGSSAGQDQQNTQGSSSSASGNPVSFAVASGEATSVIADNLVSAGLVGSRQAFLDAVNAKSAETRLRAGTFSIPPGSTPEQIVDILIS
ncbi:MAG: hypothetical protein LBK04_02950 [Clostridiales Family XIII bacterium]|nr:hypothetical protein [Clostridiales Family XIII bacterium]